jgi:protein-tyrosine phosphatase
MLEQPTQPISENLWWVLPNKLAGVRKPTAEELIELQESGIKAIVSVLDDSDNLALYNQMNIPHLWLPTQGGAAPSVEQVQKLHEFIDQQSQIGNAVGIHCTNGRRRTATMIAAYLISSGSSFEAAMQKIQSANPNIDLREAQITFLQVLVRK